jgi:hypothetical protein
MVIPLRASNLTYFYTEFDVHTVVIVWRNFLDCIIVKFREAHRLQRNISAPISNGNTWVYIPKDGTPEVFILWVSVLEVTKMTNVYINIQQYKTVTVNKTL